MLGEMFAWDAEMIVTSIDACTIVNSDASSSNFETLFDPVGGSSVTFDYTSASPKLELALKDYS